MRALSAALALGMWTTQAAATPCVSATFDVPVPGATDVTSYVTDLPSPSFPAFWQKGRLDGYGYRIFADASGVVRGLGQYDEWAVELQCDPVSEACTFTRTGAPPEAAQRVADRLSHCLIPALAPVDAPTQTRQPPSADIIAEARIEPAPQPVVEAEPEPCGIALIDEEAAIATLQRLLILLGEDPGPVDGFLGPNTFSAMAPFIDNPNWNTPIPDLLIELSIQHCSLVQS